MRKKPHSKQTFRLDIDLARLLDSRARERGVSRTEVVDAALASLLTGQPVRSDVAMTGEISLRGLVLPIGGVKEKVLAAQRAGIRTVMLPARNQRDLEDIPADVRAQLGFVWMEDVGDAIRHALVPAPAAPAKA